MVSGAAARRLVLEGECSFGLTLALSLAILVVLSLVLFPRELEALQTFLVVRVLLLPRPCFTLVEIIFRVLI